ncbi:MAG: ion channel, partial [Candidatus Delongbacteria bacterium]
MTRAIRALKNIWSKDIVKIVVLLFLVLLLASLLFSNFEEDIKSLFEAIYFAVVTVSTVGYGDITPRSVPGRIITMFLIFSGMVLVSSLTATISSILISKKIKEGQGVSNIKGKNFIVLCGWNWKVEDIILSLINAGTRDIILINDTDPNQVNALIEKYTDANIKFIKGDFTNLNILNKANLQNSKGVIIVPDNSMVSSQRADEKTVFATMTIKSISDKIKVHVQLLKNETVPYIERAKAESFFISDNTVPFFITSDITDPGISDVMLKLISITDATNLASIQIPKDYVGKTFGELFSYFRSKKNSIVIALVQFQDVLEMKNINSKDVSSIDAFIKRKFEEAGRLIKDLDKKRVILNPDDEYIINELEVAVV